MADFPTGRKGIFIRYRDNLIVNLGIQNGRNKPGTNALNFMRTCYTGRKHRRGFGLYSNHLYRSILLLEVTANTGNGAAGAHPSHKGINGSIGILPNFGAGGGIVSPGIGFIYKLSRNKAMRNFFCQFICFGNSAFHALGPGGQHQFGPISFHQLAALHTHTIRHNNDNTITASRRHRSQTNSGIAGGGLNDDRLRGKHAFLLGILNHGQGNTILDRTRRIKIFQLGQNTGFQAIFFLEMGQFQQRSMTNELGCGSINFCHDASSLCKCYLFGTL